MWRTQGSWPSPWPQLTVAGVPACWGQASIGPAGRATPHGHQGSELGSQSSPPLLCALVSPSVNGAGPTSQRRQPKRGLRTSDWPGWGTWGPGDTVGGFPGPQGSPGLESGPHWEHFSIKEAFCTVSHGLPHPHQELTGPLIKICLSRLKLQSFECGTRTSEWPAMHVCVCAGACTCACACACMYVRARAWACACMRVCVRACVRGAQAAGPVSPGTLRPSWVPQAHPCALRLAPAVAGGSGPRGCRWWGRSRGWPQPSPLRRPSCAHLHPLALT